MAKIADRNNLKAERILWTHGLREFHYGRDLPWHSGSGHGSREMQ